MTTTTTVLSACGGFIARRKSQIQAKNIEHMKANAGQCATPAAAASDCARLAQLQPDSATASATTTKTVTGTACNRLNAQPPFRQIHPVYYLVLGALLLLSSSYPSSTEALPRRLSGRHLILPHRHHVHLRSAGQEHHHHLKIIEPQGINITNCSQSTSVMRVTKESIAKAIQDCNNTRQGIQELLEKYLRVQHHLPSEEAAAKQYEWHYLNLEYPLSVEANNSNYDGLDTLSPDVELPKMLESLAILQNLMQIITENQHKNVTEDFQNITEKIYHNKSNILEMLDKDESCFPISKYSYNDRHALIEYGVINESIKLLDVIEKKYKRMLKKLEDEDEQMG